jgi:putative ABC transport system permease protein
MALVISAIPAIIVVALLYRWKLSPGVAAHALARMIAQLFIIGYLLILIFASSNSATSLALIAVMTVAAAWISMRPLKNAGGRNYLVALLAIMTGGFSTLTLVVGFVFDMSPWYSPQFAIPLAGMIMAACMNAVSLAAERYEADCIQGSTYVDARNHALHAAMIPVINSLFAVGVVSLPGMMTGQILSGISPLVAARYQIVVMFMLFGAAGISATAYLLMQKTND